MQKLRFLVSLLAVSFGTGFSQNGSHLDSSSVYLADPTIFLHNGTYYLYGTNGDPEFSKKQGFLVYTSRDLKTWEGPKGATDGLALKRGDSFGDKGFWRHRSLSIKISSTWPIPPTSILQWRPLIVRWGPLQIDLKRI
jgi:hypothetical protein